jgi:hypothetical protein
MAVRIQLASNFQVVELTYDDWSEVNYQEVADATTMVNRLGSEVVNDIKTNKVDSKKPEEEMATPGQIKYLVSLGVSEDVAKKMTKKSAWKYLQENKTK